MKEKNPISKAVGRPFLLGEWRVISGRREGCWTKKKCLLSKCTQF